MMSNNQVFVTRFLGAHPEAFNEGDYPAQDADEALSWAVISFDPFQRERNYSSYPMNEVYQQL